MWSVEVDPSYVSFRECVSGVSSVVSTVGLAPSNLPPSDHSSIGLRFFTSFSMGFFFHTEKKGGFEILGNCDVNPGLINPYSDY